MPDREPLEPQIVFAPCEIGECPDEIIRHQINRQSPDSKMAMIALCARVCAKIVIEGRFDMLAPKGVIQTDPADGIPPIVFGPSRCPMRTPYGLRAMGVVLEDEDDY